MEFKNLKVYQPDGSFRTGSLTISGDRMSAAEPTAEAVDMGGLYAVPGLVDLHFHGCVGYDFCDGTHEGDLRDRQIPGAERRRSYLSGDHDLSGG